LALPCVGPYSNKAYGLEFTLQKEHNSHFPNFSIFLTFNWNYCSIFHWFKHCETTLAFQQCKVCDTQHCGLGDLNVTNKTNKQTNKLHSLVDRWSHLLMSTHIPDFGMCLYMANLWTCDICYLPQNFGVNLWFLKWKPGKKKKKGGIIIALTF